MTKNTTFRPSHSMRVFTVSSFSLTDRPCARSSRGREPAQAEELAVVVPRGPERVVGRGDTVGHRVVPVARLVAVTVKKTPPGCATRCTSPRRSRRKARSRARRRPGTGSSRRCRSGRGLVKRIDRSALDAARRGVSQPAVARPSPSWAVRLEHHVYAGDLELSSDSTGWVPSSPEPQRTSVALLALQPRAVMARSSPASYSSRSSSAGSRSGTFASTASNASRLPLAARSSR